MSESIPELCPLFGKCGGCELQGLSWEEYAHKKGTNIKASFERFDIPTSNIAPPHLLKGPWRRRAILKATATSQGVHIGFYERKSHTVVDMRVCLVLVPEIVAFLPALRALLKGILSTKKSAEIAVLHTAMGLDVAITSKDLPTLSLNLIQKLTDFAGTWKLARLHFGGELVVQHHAPQVCFSNTWVDASASGFLQASDQADRYLTQSLLEVLPETCDKAFDLFCGRGLFSFALATRTRSVHSYDNDEAALAALTRATRRVPGSPIKAHTRHLFNDPLSQKELMGAQVVVLDPPRVGALAQCRVLADSKVPLLVYVSCNPETFARDARVLQDTYQLRLVQPLDQFLWSPHIELMAVFDLR